MVDAYQKAGVDLQAGYTAVNRIKKHAKSTSRPEVIGGLGAFGGMFDLSGYALQAPVLVSGTDGVGTKLMLAFQLNKHDTIGIDVVAMCVNDIVAQGAEPLYFLDYIACGHLDPQQIEAIVSGMATGCKQAGAALIGGETAEMPAMYDEQTYDLAGFSVGIAEKSQLITGDHIEAGDRLIGLASNGVHSNGFSLIRQIIARHHLNLHHTYEGMDRPLGEELLRPTRIYVSFILAAHQSHRLKGVAHITGGGLFENMARMLPSGYGVELDVQTWQVPPIFQLLQHQEQVTTHEMASIFNLGIGMVVAVSPQHVDETVKQLQTHGDKAYVIGRVTEGEHVDLTGDML